MNKLYRGIWALLLGWALLACSEDLGNYAYRDLVEPEISGVDAQISVLAYGRLQLSPDLGKNEFPGDRYEFEWKTVAKDQGQATTVIGSVLSLDYEVMLPAGGYTLFFTVREKASGLFWQEAYELQVNDVTSAGWMVLCSEDGRVRLDMVSAVTGATYRDILSNNGMPVMNGPRRIQSLPANKTDKDSPFYLLTDEGATRLGKNNFEWKPEYDMVYEMATGKKTTPHSISYGGVGKMFVSGTEAYYCDNAMGDGLYGSVVNKTYPVAPVVGVNVSAGMNYAAVYMMYDTDNKRFIGSCPLLLAMDLGLSKSEMELNEMGELADAVNEKDKGVVGNAFDEFPRGYDYVYMENTRYDPGNAKMGVTYTVLSDGAQRYLYGIQLGDMLVYMDCPYVLGKAYYGDLSACKDITRVTDLFAFSSLKNFMYYAVDNTVYRVDLSVRPLKSEMQFSLSGETITCLKFNLYQKSEHLSRSYDLVVGSLKGGEGLLRVYNGMTADGDFRTVTPDVHSGFTKIVDATYRE